MPLSLLAFESRFVRWPKINAPKRMQLKTACECDHCVSLRKRIPGQRQVLAHRSAQRIHRKKLNRFFFSEASGRPHAELAIWRMAWEMGEFLRTSGIAVFCIFRTTA